MRRRSADADLALGRDRVPVLRAAAWARGHGRERAVRLHYGERAVGPAAPGPVPVLPGNAHAAAVLDGPAPRRRRRGDRPGPPPPRPCTEPGSARLGAELGVPAATVRGWLRRLRCRAGDLRQDATAALGVITAGRDWPCLAPCGSPLGDALAAVIACARAAIACHGYAEEDLDALLGLFGIAAALAPAPGS